MILTPTEPNLRATVGSVFKLFATRRVVAESVAHGNQMAICEIPFR